MQNVCFWSRNTRPSAARLKRRGGRHIQDSPFFLSIIAGRYSRVRCVSVVTLSWIWRRHLPDRSRQTGRTVRILRCSPAHRPEYRRAWSDRARMPTLPDRSDRWPESVKGCHTPFPVRMLPAAVLSGCERPEPGCSLRVQDAGEFHSDTERGAGDQSGFAVRHGIDSL